MPPDPQASAMEAAAKAVYDHPMSDGDALAVLIHCSDYVDGGVPMPEQLRRTLDICAGIAQAAVAAYERAQWSTDTEAARGAGKFLAEWQPPGADKPQTIIAEWIDHPTFGSGFYGWNVQDGTGYGTISSLMWGWPESKLCILRWAPLRLPPPLPGDGG